MNFFAHALPHLDRPMFVVGTGMPDWMARADRKLRFRPRKLEPWFEHADEAIRELALGTQQHLDDDGWFHATRGFAEVTGVLGRWFREALAPDDGFRCSLLGHIAMEMLLDVCLMEAWPAEFERWYALLEQTDYDVVAGIVAQFVPPGTERLAPLLRRFAAEQILRDYATAEGLLWRLNQVQRLITLPELPASAAELLIRGRIEVRQRMAELLPAEFYPAKFVSV